MFQLLAAACACKKVNSIHSVFGLRLNRWVLLILLVLQIPGIVVAENAVPVWTVPVQQTSDDGYAHFAWESDGESARLFKITETFDGRVTVHYTESTDLRAWRVKPGEYEFVLQSCVKNVSESPDCGNLSEALSLQVSEGLTSLLLANSTTKTPPPISADNLNGGPGELRPGHWYNPAKNGHGWSFYWSNRLALAEDDPLLWRRGGSFLQDRSFILWSYPD